MTDTTDLVAELRDEVLRLSGRSIDRGCVDSGLGSLLAEKAADTIERITRERDEARQWVDDESRKLENMEARAHTAEAERDKANAAAEACSDTDCACRMQMRAALEAVAPAIRAEGRREGMEEAAKVADAARISWHEEVRELEREYLELARERYAVSAAAEIAAAIRAMAERAGP